MKRNYHWIILFIGTYCITVYGFVFQSIPPLINTLVKELHISFTQAGSLMGAFSLPGMIFALPGGMLADKFGSKRVGTISLLIFSLGTFGVSFSDSYLCFAFGRFITGVGAAMILVIAPLAVTSWFYDKRIGLAMSIFNISVPLGTILSLNVIGAIATQFGWRMSIWCTFFATLSASLLFFIFYRSRENSSSPPNKETPSQESGNSKKMGLGIWLVGLSFALYGAGSMQFFTFGPDFFVSRGISNTQAGLLSSYPMWPTIFLAPLVGFLIDRFKKTWLFVSIGCLGASMMLVVILLQTHYLVLSTLIFGVFLMVLVPAIYALPAEILPEEKMGFGFGLLTMGLSLGIFVGSLVVGWIRDSTGDYRYGFYFMAITTFMAIFPMIKVGWRHSKQD